MMVFFLLGILQVHAMTPPQICSGQVPDPVIPRFMEYAFQYPSSDFFNAVAAPGFDTDMYINIILVLLLHHG